jgi:hypothetical protein
MDNFPSEIRRCKRGTHYGFCSHITVSDKMPLNFPLPPGDVRNFSIFPATVPALRPIQRALEALSQGLHRPGREAPFGVEIKNE